MFHIFGKKNNKTAGQHAPVQKTAFKIDGMHCVSCSMNIDGELEELAGVKSATTSYAKATCVVEYDPQKIGTEEIMQTVSRLGYTLEPLVKKD